MNAQAVGPVSQKFDVDYEKFMRSRQQIQREFVASRFEVLEDAWRESGTDATLDEWLLSTPGLHNRYEGWHFWSNLQTNPFGGDDAIWEILFANDFGCDGRLRFVEAFNKVLGFKKMRARLGDNGVQMYFIDVARQQS